MTEAEWLSSTSPEAMLEFLQGKAGDRKLRLFAVACCRRVGHLLADPRSRRAVEVAERFADRQVQPEELRVAMEGARMAWNRPAEAAAYEAAGVEAAQAARDAARHAAWAVGPSPSAEELKVLAGLLRCVVGNPFARLQRPGPAVLRWHDGTVVRIAQGIYEERAFERLPVLADALLDAGCDNDDMLAHCRQQEAVHARGCWVIDLLLGKDQVAQP